MDRVAVFVDAGYLFAQGSRLLAGQKLTRGQLTLRHDVVIEKLRLFAQEIARVPLVRIYWYDGTSTGPTSQHLTLAHLADVKVRLGFVNTVGEQKGVDSLIVTDMITLARNHAMCDAVLLSGDEDVRVGVQQAQEFGVRRSLHRCSRAWKRRVTRTPTLHGQPRLPGVLPNLKPAHSGRFPGQKCGTGSSIGRGLAPSGDFTKVWIFSGCRVPEKSCTGARGDSRSAGGS